MTNKEIRIPAPIDLGRTFEFNMEILWDHYTKHLNQIKSGEALVIVQALFIQSSIYYYYYF